MLTKRKIILVFLLFLLVKSYAFSEETSQNKNVLILFALSPGTPAYRAITDGIRTELVNAYGDAVNLRMEYLESEHYPAGEYPKERFELFNLKYEDVRIDLLICVGIDIIDPVKKNASEEFLHLPTITMDFDLSDYDNNPDFELNDKTAVIGMKLDVPAILKTALELFPDRHSVYFISGTSKADLLYLNATRALEGKFDKRYKYTFINNVSMDEALNEVRNIHDSSLIVVTGFIVDSKGVPYYNPESIRLISQAANAPVIIYSDMGFGDGAIGGYLLSFKKIGKLAGETAVKILGGTDPASIIISENDTYEYLFDWRQLKRWNLAESVLPKGSRIMFREVGFFERYRWIITIVSLFVVLQSLLILNLVRMNRKQKLVTRQLIDSENRFRELVREDRILRLGQLTASLSHELNQPLTAILSTAQAGMRFLDSNNTDPEMLKEIFQNIVEDDKRTASILSSIRSMMKLEQREKESVNLNMLIEELITIYQSETTEKQIKLDVKLADQPAYILADPIQIQQVIMNLLLNAIQSIEKAESKNRLVIIEEVADKAYVTVSVRDYGEGIADSVKDKLFKPFVTSKKEGTGIGLAISRSIIDDHQGKILAENMPDGGAKFTFSLKICQDEPARQ